MIKIRYILFVFFLLQINFCFGKNKYALVIAIADYTESSGWLPLSADNDAAIIQFALHKQDFAKDKIRILKDSEATKQGIVKAMETLERQVQEGDVVFIHFSGHGQQIFDDSKDELDDFDEALIPFDAQKEYSKNYKGENHLRDDEIYRLLLELRQKLGVFGEVIFTIDACNSGTAARVRGKYRGSESKFFNPSNKNIALRTRVGESFFHEFYSSENDFSEVAPLVVISASAQDELNYEYIDDKGNAYGSLSFALARLFSTIQANMTYRAFFERIKLEMQKIVPNQTPEIEGRLDKFLFGGSLAKQEPFFKVSKVVSGNTIVINSGSIMGLTKGSRLGVYPLGTRNHKSKKSLAEGEIISLKPLSATLKLDRSIPKKDLKRAWVFAERIAFDNDDLKMYLDLQTVNVSPFKEQLSEILGVEFVSDLERAEFALIEEHSGLKMFDYSGRLLFQLKISSSMKSIVSSIIDGMHKYKQAKRIRELNVKDARIDVDIELIPVTVKKSNGRWEVDKVLESNTKMKRGSYLFKKNECFKIKIINRGSQKAYYQIVDVMPDDEVVVLYPSAESSRIESECVINPNSEIELNDIFIIGEKSGTEVFKTIATLEPIYLNSIISSKGFAPKENVHNIEELFVSSYYKKKSLPPSVETNCANVNTKLVVVE